MSAKKAYDAAVIGAGVFGAWTALQLRRAGLSVALCDAYGPANSRASSGGESRLIRMGYGADENFTRWSWRSLGMWKELFAWTGKALFCQTGILWIFGDDAAANYATATRDTLTRVGIPHETMERAELEKRWPQIDFGEARWGLFEQQSGVLLARRAVAAVVEAAIEDGVEYSQEAVEAPRGSGRVGSVQTRLGREIPAGQFIFCCGPWMGKVFPELLGNRIFVTRQEVFFFGVPAGDRRFAPPAMPGWLYLADLFYGMPDLESRGIKIAHDKHGPPCDPDSQERVPSPEAIATAREYLAKRFPALANAPLVEARVCQYENSSNGDFLVDKHPNFENVWLVGGGSGHGFKHGPAMGEHVAAVVTGSAKREPRFSLETKREVQKRIVF
ncbi:MAG TPA: FAD-dependent oxidoreductase [Candidatus Acidoferrales bacterium]|nr:FAD-dependent oxidoreductase [Candidatus Acidoferrales bacterium]